MLKKRFIKILLACSLISLCSFEIQAASRTPTFTYDSRFSRGVGNTCYYVSGSALKYEKWIRNAASLWEYNGWTNPIYMTQSTSNYATHMDFYAATPEFDSNLDYNTNAYTMVYDSNSNSMYFGTGNWFYAEITINKDAMPNQATMVHEMGHAFGLNHYPTNKYSIMYNYSSDRLVTSPQEVDVASINYLYN